MNIIVNFIILSDMQQLDQQLSELKLIYPDKQKTKLSIMYVIYETNRIHI